MADLGIRTSGATKAAARTIDPVTVFMQTSLLKVEISSDGADMTEDDRTWDTRLTKTARKNKSQ